MQLRVALMLLLLAHPVWAATASPKVIGGQDASGHWPWAALVSVSYNSTNDAYCSGMLISPNWVITAAHCMFSEPTPSTPSQPATSVSVKIGSYPIDPSSPRTPDGVKQHYVPASYTTFNDFKTGDDIALLHLSNAASSSAYPSITDAPHFNAVALSNVWDRDEAVTVFGWGKTSNGSDSLSSTLQQASIDYVPFPTCNSEWSNQLVQSKMICAAELNPINGVKQDTCQGDSGGPLFIGDNPSPYVIGLTSFGQPSCPGSLPSVYTDLLHEVGFIETTTRDAGDPLVDLAAAPTVDRYYAVPGGSMTVPVTMTNNSLQNTVTNTTFADSTQASGLTLTTSTASSGGSCTGNKCSLPDLKHGESASVTIQASQIPTGGEAEDTLNLNAGSSEDDYRLKNNTPTVKLIFSNKPDLTVSAALAGSTRPSAGQGIARIAVHVRDLSTVSGADAGDAQLTATLPANTTLSGANNGVSCGNTTCDLGALSNATPLAFTLTLTSSQPATGDLVLTVSNKGPAGEFPTDNNDATVHFGYPAPPPPSRGGGGGAVGLGGLALLMMAGLRRR